MNRNKTVLVISDSHEQFTSTASLLQDEGYCVRFEKDVSHGLSLASVEAPYLIISELAGPNVDGLQLCRRVRDNKRLGAIPVLLVGDLSKQSSIVTDGFRCGAAEYLQRPIDPCQLANICRTMLAPGEDSFGDSTDTHTVDQNLRPPAVVSWQENNDEGFSLDDVLRNGILRKVLFDTSRVGIAIFSSVGDLVESNQALAQLLDYSEDQLRDLTLSDFVNPYDFENDKRLIEEVILGKRSHYNFKNGYLTPRGERLWGQFTIVSIPGHDNDTHFLIAIFDDPTHPDETLLSDGDRLAAMPVENSAVPGVRTWQIDMRKICSTFVQIN